MKIFLYFPAMMALLLTAFAAQAHEIQVTDAWLRAAPPNAPALGVFMQIENASDGNHAVVAARTTLDVARVELHRTMMQDGVMQMVPHDRIPLAAETTTRLEPGSWHVMLITPKTVPVEGETIGVTLVFDDGTEQTVTAEVRKGQKMAGEGKHMHKHKHKHKHGGSSATTTN